MFAKKVMAVAIDKIWQPEADSQCRQTFLYGSTALETRSRSCIVLLVSSDDRSTLTLPWPQNVSVGLDSCSMTLGLGEPLHLQVAIWSVRLLRPDRCCSKLGRPEKKPPTSGPFVSARALSHEVFSSCCGSAFVSVCLPYGDQVSRDKGHRPANAWRRPNFRRSSSFVRI